MPNKSKAYGEATRAKQAERSTAVKLQSWEIEIIKIAENTAMDFISESHKFSSQFDEKLIQQTCEKIRLLIEKELANV